MGRRISRTGENERRRTCANEFTPLSQRIATVICKPNGAYSCSGFGIDDADPCWFRVERYVRPAKSKCLFLDAHPGLCKQCDEDAQERRSELFYTFFIVVR